MKDIFIRELKIEHVRHLMNIVIPVCEEKKKHLILTGKNGSGKTSVLDALAAFLENISVTDKVISYEESLQTSLDNLSYLKEQEDLPPGNELYEREQRVQYWETHLKEVRQGIALRLNHPLDSIHASFEQSEFVIAYYKADRVFQADLPQHVEKIVLKDKYDIIDEPRKDFVKYLLDLKMTEALAISGSKNDKAAEIQNWFAEFENLLKRIFEEDSVKLIFDEETFTFSIQMNGRDLFDFNSLSSGYAAVLDIVVDLMLRMERKSRRKFRYDFPGIVLIDEIETHLHLDLQKKILDLLTTVFPKIQFVLSTHSPFVLNSQPDVVIYDLENRVLVKDGLSDVPYDGIVEGYFHVDTMSGQLKEKLNRYREMVKQEQLTDKDFREIAELELFLDEIPGLSGIGCGNRICTTENGAGEQGGDLMVRIERSYPEPPSLKEERKKEAGSYSKEDVVEQLKRDFYNKCYICELKDLQDPQVEHLLPHKNGTYRDRKFDWENLFWACSHCNGVKNKDKYEEKILDCCKTDPEQRIYFWYADGNVNVEAKCSEDEMARCTAELVQEVFNVRNTGMRVYRSEHRMKELQKEMNLLYRNLLEFKKNPQSKTVQRKIQGLLKKDSPFAAFKRCYIREHKKQFPGWYDYIRGTA